MTIGRIDINEKDLPKICGAIIQLEERADSADSSGSSGSGGGAGGSPGGRLTLQTLTPVMTTTQSAKTTIYYTPYNGSTVPLYDGTNFSGTAFSELSAATTDTTKSPAAIGAAKVNDWFVWLDGSTVRLSHGPDWTNDTTRSAGTALVMVNGILLNSVALTNGPAASRGTYVGSTRSNGSSQLDWIYGTAATNGGAAVLLVWNCYNRVNIGTVVTDTTASWTYAVSDYRNVNGSSTNRVYYVAGLAEDAIQAFYGTVLFGSGNATVAIGIDSSTVPSGALGYVTSSGLSVPTAAGYYGMAGLGMHFVQAIEFGAASSTFTGQLVFAGDVYQQMGLMFAFRM